MHETGPCGSHLRRAVRPAIAASPASFTPGLFCSCRLVRRGRRQAAAPAPVMPAHSLRFKAARAVRQPRFSSPASVSEEQPCSRTGKGGRW